MAFREITRAWDRRATAKGTEAGRAGLAGLRVPDGPWYLTDANGNYQELPAHIVTVLMEQAMSPLTDSLSGKHALSEAVASFEAKRADLIAGKYNVRGDGGVNPIVAEMRRLIGLAWKSAETDKEGRKWADHMEADDYNDLLDEKIARQKGAAGAALRERAEANVSERETERAARAAKKAADAEATRGVKV